MVDCFVHVYELTDSMLLERIVFSLQHEISEKYVPEMSYPTFHLFTDSRSINRTMDTENLLLAVAELKQIKDILG